VSSVIVSDQLVRKAVVERLESAARQQGPPGYWFRPVPIPAGCFLVLPDGPSADPEQSFSSDSAAWRLVIMFVAGAFDEETAAEELSSWSAPKGPFISSLTNFDLVFTDTLSTLGQDIRVTSYGSMNTMTATEDNETLYYKSVKVQIKV
jgi:hypothetical protein